MWSTYSQTSKLILLAHLSFMFIIDVQAHIGQEKIIKIPDGKIKGITMESINGRQFISYQGIPYGKPPIGNLRFQPPQKAEPWEGVIDGTKPAELCLQSDLLSGVSIGSEDCLTLAVSTPQINDTFQELYPVIVYIFGGMFVFGPILRSSPERLLDNNLLYVEPNYRLGILGYASTSDEVLPGNYAQLDQILALKWVQENIAYFGGDPNRVTMMGHSSGAMSTMSNIISPLANGLVHGAIMHSGCRICEIMIDNSTSSTLEYAQRANCPTESSKSMRDCLRNAPASKLQRRYEDITIPFNSNFDNKSGYMPHPIMEMPFQPNVQKIPVIIGLLPNDGAFLFKDSNKSTEAKIGSILEFLDIQQNRPELVKQITRKYDISHDSNKTAEEILHTLQDIMTDVGYKYCCDNSIELLAKAGYQTYAYVYRNHGSVTKKRYSFREFDHSSDLDLVFVLPQTYNLTGNDLLTSKAILHYWTNFATYGDPSPRNMKTGGETYSKWEPWTKDNPRHIVLERNPFMESGNFCDYKQFWDSMESLLKRENT